jgi:hypothetical protein
LIIWRIAVGKHMPHLVDDGADLLTASYCVDDLSLPVEAVSVREWGFLQYFVALAPRLFLAGPAE